MGSERIKKIHFMGIGGSGMSAVAMIASKQGYKVSGCDLAESTPYLDKIKKLNIPIFVGHDSKHLKGIDLLVATPAAFFQSSEHPEFVEAKKLKLLTTWQEFLGNYLHRGKKVICIAGTHGKSTTTAMASLLLEKADIDPTVMIGATVNEWGANYRVGKSEIFITEADEFFDNFLNYRPDTIILNNIELDHPDFFKSERQVLESFARFVRKLAGSKTLIVNQDSPGIKALFKILGGPSLDSIKAVGYSLEEKPRLKTSISIRAKILKRNKNSTIFHVVSKQLKLNDEFKLKMPGSHNVANALGVIILSKLFKIDTTLVKNSLASYSGIGRRLELVGKKKGIWVYDDYAHHPTAVSATLEALRQQFPKERIWVVAEPHSYSRTKTLLGKYKKAFNKADFVIIGPIFKARDKKTFDVSGQSIVDVAEHGDIRYIDNLDKIAKVVKRSAKREDVIVVMGAGLSYQWARAILNNL